jgi:acetyltransferase-like isoleucine patch superfamily enzyme
MREALRAWIDRWKLLRCRKVGRAPRVRGRVWIHGRGAVVLGDRVVIDAPAAPIELHAHAGATIVIGDDCRLEDGASIEATEAVDVGARCRLGAFCKVMDSHFHPLDGDRHRPTRGAPVRLEDDVVLGPWAVVLASAHVGRGTSIGAATVVRRRVPAHAVVRGNPPGRVPRLAGGAS